MENMKLLDVREMMRQERRLIKWHVPLDLVIWGPKIDKLSKEGNPDAIVFPKAHINDAPYDFSFSESSQRY